MPRKSILTLFGTRPEVIKLAPVILQLEKRKDVLDTINVFSGQHADLVRTLAEFFGIRIDCDCRLMTFDQDPEELLRRAVRRVCDIVRRERPDLVVVQGDTSTALAGAIAGNRCGIPVAHVEAGLRSGSLFSPYPEEVNRISITRLATLHFAATESNRDSLLREGVAETSIVVTGNPIVDALKLVLDNRGSQAEPCLIRCVSAPKCIVLTTHRRESFGRVLEQNLRVIRSFVEEHADTHLVFPVHPNPNTRILAFDILGDHPRITLTSALPYAEFIGLLSKCWLVISDSGGVQEEVPSLGKPLLILRENTERQECIETGIARLVGGRPEVLRAMLEEACQPGSWVNSVHKIANPFGSGNSAERIVRQIVSWLQVPQRSGAPSQFVPTSHAVGGTAPVQFLQ